jgi:LDH2 family malate/lactate/ureidoglycolate dehydrogenase
MNITLSLTEARALAIAALQSLSFTEEEAAITADHLVDAALRGVTFGSLPRILSIAEKMAESGDHRRPIRTIRETPVSALLDGGDHVGYVVAYRATKLAIEKAKKTGIAIVGANNTFYSGLFSYYMEMATREGLVAFAVGNGPSVVAPEGAIDARLGTNPVSFGFPSKGDPVIWDIGTCAIMHGEVQLHRRLGEPLPEGTAIDKNGNPTRDPTEALAGAIKAWGGHRGSGLSIVVQLLGAMCDAPVISPGMSEMAYLVVVIDPTLLMPEGNYPDRVTELSDAIRSARPLKEGQTVRMPFDRSASDRRERRAKDAIEVPQRVHAALVAMASKVTQ